MTKEEFVARLHELGVSFDEESDYSRLQGRRRCCPQANPVRLGNQAPRSGQLEVLTSVAQLVGHQPMDLTVTGSIPVAQPTSISPRPLLILLLSESPVT